MSKRSLGVDLFVCFPFQSTFDLLMASALEILNMMTRFPSKQVNKPSNDSLGLVCHYSGDCTVITKDSSCSATTKLREGRSDRRSKKLIPREDGTVPVSLKSSCLGTLVT